MIVIAAYYVLFAAIAASRSVLATEIVIGFCFSLLAVIGFASKNPLLVAAAILGHGVFDLFHSSLINNPGTPLWWPGFCLAADIVIGGWVVFQTFVNKETRRAAAA